MTRSISLAGAAAMALALLLPTGAEAKPARCVIKQGGELTYSGPCDFTGLNGDGSFSIDPIGKRRFYEGNLGLTIWMEGRGRANVSATNLGNSSNMGSYVRSTKDKACWMSEEGPASICVY